MVKTFSFLLLGSVVLSASCVNKLEGEGINRGVEIAAIESMTDFQVPVKAGYTTVVTYGDEVLAITRKTITIAVPAVATRASQLEVSYSNEDIFGEFGSAEYWQYIGFEDTANGDYDYNDVVIHCRVKSDVPWNYTGNQLCKHVVSVQPVALGGTRKVKLGILYRDDAGKICEKILCEDIRRDLFLGNPTFPINTDRTKPTKKVTNYLTDLFECETREVDFRVVWFLESGDDRLYAATTNFGLDKSLAMISRDGLPFGISMTKKWCYPVEKCHIRDAYPHFDEWLKSGNEAVLLRDPKHANTFPATIPQGADGDLWDWQKR